MKTTIRRGLESRKQKLDNQLVEAVRPNYGGPVLRGRSKCYELAQRVQGIDCGGIGMIQQLVQVTGLAREIDQRVQLLKLYMPYHESDHVLNIAYNIMCGGQVLEDIERRRNDPAGRSRSSPPPQHPREPRRPRACGTPRGPLWTVLSCPYQTRPRRPVLHPIPVTCCRVGCRQTTSLLRWRRGTLRPLRNSRRYPAYVSWETYEEIQRTLRDNHAEYTKHKTRGIPREGAAVLHGITYCGVCGYKMRVQYSPEARYICNYHQTQQPGSGVCQNLPAEEIDKAVVNAFFAALQPAELDLYSEALQAHQDQAKELVAAQQRELQRLQYEADLARRQYDRVDPDNRLVAGELERRWEAALRELRETEQRMRSEQQARDNVIALHVPQKLRESFSALGERLPKIWSSPLLHQAQRKALLRCLVDKVVLHRCDAAWETVRVRVVWRGGAVTAMDVPVPVATASRLSTMD